jgi:NSS family neurotransmitter:Na+ symporter
MSERAAFGSRFGMMLAMLGMAVGTGNIWRFPRIAAQNGGGEFLVAWVVFLLLWSIPLILLEFGMGRLTRSGPVRTFALVMGPRYAWMGAFAAFAGVAIGFYYSVVAGWTFRYAAAALLGEIPEAVPGRFWVAYTGSWWPVLTHAIAIGISTLVVARGVRAIESVAKVLMPSLIVLVLILTARALTLPGSSEGLAFLFGIDWERLGEARLWLEALTQNAWDTGAGWGLVLCYAAYLREREDTVLNAFVLPAANNAISLLAGIMVLCTVFSVVPRMTEQLASDPAALAAFPALEQAVAGGQRLSPELIQDTIFTAGNEGITFVWMPQLFETLPLGRWLMLLFFLALSFAAITSLIAMVELGSRVLVDAGVGHARAVRLVGATTFAAGLPSALSMRFLNNQDWVWSVALMVAGLFFSIAVIRHGVRRFRETQLNHPDSDIRVGPWWEVVIGVLVPLQAVVLLAWWLYQAWRADPGRWLDPLAVGNVGTVLAQFAVVLGVLLLINGRLARASLRAEDRPGGLAPTGAGGGAR